MMTAKPKGRHALEQLKAVAHTESSAIWLAFLETEIDQITNMMVTTEDDATMHRHQGAVRKLRDILRRVQRT
jgi:hypothetical protein